VQTNAPTSRRREYKQQPIKPKLRKPKWGDTMASGNRVLLMGVGVGWHRGGGKTASLA